MLAIPFTYEHLREVEFIDKALEHVEEIAIARQNAKADEGLEVMLHGAPDDDDLDLGGTIVRLQELDEDATDTITPKAWYMLQKKFKRRTMLTSAIGFDKDVTELQLAKISGTNVMLVTMNERENAVQSGFGGGFSVMNQRHRKALGLAGTITFRTGSGGAGNAKYNCIVVYDVNKAIEYVSQMGTDIVETTRDMLKQVEYIVCSEIWGWISYMPKTSIFIVVMGNPSDGTKLRILD